MTYWQLISTGNAVQTGDPVGSDRITTSPARAGTGEPLHRLEPVPVRPESDRRHALLLGEVLPRLGDPDLHVPRACRRTNIVGEVPPLPPGESSSGCIF